MVAVPINYIEIVDGRARIAGRRITVQDIVAMHVWNNSPIEWIADEYDLSYAQIYAALAYYYDNKEAIDRAFEDDERLARELATPSEEVLARMRARQQKKSE